MFERILGQDLPVNKRFSILLTYLFGLGKSSTQSILKKINIDEKFKPVNISNKIYIRIRKYIESRYLFESILKRKLEIFKNRLKKIKSYRGYRNTHGLPVRGQRTHTNAKTTKRLKKNQEEKNVNKNTIKTPWVKR